MTMTGAARQLAGRSRGQFAAMAGFTQRSFAALTREQAQEVMQIRPDPVGTIRRSGVDPYRILLFGSGVLRGVGLRDHDLGLPGRIADELATRRPRGVSIDVVVEPHPTSPAALAGLGGMRLRRYDAVIVVLGEHESGPTVEARWRGALVGLAKLLTTETSVPAGLFIYDSTRASSPTLTMQTGAREAAAAGRRLAVVEEVCGLSRRIRFGEVPPAVLAADPVRGFTDGTYRDWASWMTDRLEPALTISDHAVEDDSPRRFRDRVQVEPLRQRAVASLRLRFGDRDEDLDREVRQAKLMYRASMAALTIVDGPTVWTRATTEAQVRVVDRAAAFCDLGVRTDGLLLINDTWVDPQTRDNPLLRDQEGIRFYAGYPVRTWDGYRVGMVCVLGETPRSLAARDLEGLRDVAARVERTLWLNALTSGQR
jgi:hypothetical protein